MACRRTAITTKANRWSTVTAIARNGFLPQTICSRRDLGIKAKIEFMADWFAVFNASTGINPQSGQLANMAATNIKNNGLPRAAYSETGDGARAGQAFNDEFYGGASSTFYGTLTFGRQRSLGTDSMLAYDPAGGAYSFSYIGYNGTMAGGGDTEDTRWDQAIKYRLAYGPFHAGAMYKFADGSGGCYSASKTWSAGTCTPEQAHNSAFGFDLGGEYRRDFRGRRFPTLQSSDQRTQPLAGPSEFESAISIDRQQHQYKSNHWRQ